MSKTQLHAGPKTPGQVQAPSFVQAHVDLVLMVPEPDDTWLSEELPERPDVPTAMAQAFSDVVQLLMAHGVIEHVRLEYNDEGKDMVRWRTDDASFQYAQRLDADRQTLPCGHRAGFENRGDGYECGFRYCTATHDRETVSEVFG